MTILCWICTIGLFLIWREVGKVVDTTRATCIQLIEMNERIEKIEDRVCDILKCVEKDDDDDF